MYPKSGLLPLMGWGDFWFVLVLGVLLGFRAHWGGVGLPISRVGGFRFFQRGFSIFPIVMLFLGAMLGALSVFGASSCLHKVGRDWEFNGLEGSRG